MAAASRPIGGAWLAEIADADVARSQILDFREAQRPQLGRQIVRLEIADPRLADRGHDPVGAALLGHALQ